MTALHHALGDRLVPGSILVRHELGGAPAGRLLLAVAKGPAPCRVNVYETAVRASHAQHLAGVFDECPPRTVVVGRHIPTDDWPSSGVPPPVPACATPEARTRTSWWRRARSRRQ